MKIKNLLLLSAILSAAMPLQTLNAQDFSVKSEKGKTIHYNILDSDEKTVEVTYKGSAFAVDTHAYEGVVVIPGKVTFEGVAYDVVQIGPNAFAGSDGLVEVVLPDAVKVIGNFAFDRCVGLETVRFPSDPVTIKEGVFFRCPSIKNVVFGKNWETVDFSHFKWSRSLTEVNIPANASNVKNIKSLAYLQTVNVDKGNTRFASVDGVLYNKRKTTLFACPLAYDAELNIASQTKEVYEGALSDCYRLKSVKFPASMDAISPRILIRADSLQSVTFALDTALVRSAKMGDKEVLAIVHPNARNIMVYVPSKLASKYKKVMKWEVMNDLKEIEGENASKEYRGDQLIPKKNVKKIKKVKISKAKPKNKES